MKNLIYHVAALLTAASLTTSAATIVSQVSGGNWDSPSTWIGGVAPTGLDDVQIFPGSSVTITTSASCASINVNNSSSVGSSLTISTTGSLVVGDGLGQLNMGSYVTSVSQESETTVEVNGTLRCGQIHMVARRFAGKDAECMLRVNHAAAIVEVDGDIIQERNAAQGGLRNQIRFGDAGLVRLKGTFIALDEGGVPSVSGPGTIEYYADGPQQIAGFNYNNLTLSGSGVKSGDTNAIISGILTIKDEASYGGDSPLYELNTSVVYAGSVPQSTGSELPVLPPEGWSITFTNALGVTLNQSISAPGTINLIAGPVITGTNVVNVVAGFSRVDGYVIGNLRKSLATGSNVTHLFELGSSNGYGSVSLTFSKINTAGNLTVSSSDGDHAAVGTANLDRDLSVNVHWTITPGIGFSINNYSAQFNFNAADLDVGTSPNLLLAGRNTGLLWTYPTVFARTATSLQLNGLTAFGSFQLAEAQRLSATIAWDAPASIVYGTAIGAAQLNASTITPGTLAYSPDIGTVLDVGTHTLSVEFTPTDSLIFRSSIQTVEIVVEQAPLVVTADNASRNYGETNPVFTGTLTGVVNGDDITAAYSSSATEASASGDYPIIATLNDPDDRLGNYSVTTSNGILTVVPNLPVAVSIQQLPNGLVLLSLQGGANQVVQIEATSSFGSGWQEIGATTTGLSGFQTFLDIDATNTATRFYRTVSP